MGQRHQIYCFVETKKGVTHQIAFHHQWCYGSLPLRHLERVIRFQTHANEYTRLGYEYSSSEAEAEKLKMILSCDPCEGLYTHYTDITDEVMEKGEKSMHPDRGDNNDGITVIHIKEKHIHYCFMNIGEGDSRIMKASPRLPLTAKEYIKLYYSQSDKEWKSFGIDKLLSYINHRTKVLTVLQCMKLFPDFYGADEVTVAKCPDKELPLHINKGQLIDLIIELRMKEAA